MIGVSGALKPFALLIDIMNGEVSRLMCCDVPVKNAGLFKQGAWHDRRKESARFMD